MSFPPPSRRQGHLFWTALSGLAIAILVGLIVLLVWGLGRVLDILSPVLWPLAVAGVVAYLLDPVVDFSERRGVSRPRAIVSVFAIAIVSVVVVVVAVVPPIVSQTRQFARSIPSITTNVQYRVDTWINNPPEWFQKYIGPGQKSQPRAPVSSETNSVPDVTETNAPAALPEENPPAPARFLR